MTKDKFNELTIKEQIQLINGLLENESLSSIGKNIGISEATIRTRFKKEGYIRMNNQFIHDNTANTRATEPVKKKIDINTLYQKIKTLEARVLSLENTNNTSNTTTVNTANTNIDNTTNIINITEFKGETVSRAYRVDKEVQEQFKIFCKRNSEHKVQDIISSALLEYMKNNQG